MVSQNTKIQTVLEPFLLACWVVYGVKMYKVRTGNDGNLEWLLGGAIGGHSAEELKLESLDWFKGKS